MRFGINYSGLMTVQEGFEDISDEKKSMSQKAWAGVKIGVTAGTWFLGAKAMGVGTEVRLETHVVSRRHLRNFGQRRQELWHLNYFGSHIHKYNWFKPWTWWR